MRSRSSGERFTLKRMDASRDVLGSEVSAVVVTPVSTPFPPALREVQRTVRVYRDDLPAHASPQPVDCV